MGRFLTRCQVRKAQAKCFELLYFLFRFIHREEQTTFFTKSLKVIFIHKFKMVREDKATWKAGYFTKIVQLLDEYPKCFLVEADNVGSKQMQQIRISLRGHAVVLMGKNTMMRKAIRGHLVNNPKLECLMNRVKAPAKAGALAPLDVKVPAQNTGLGPEKTSFFQALNIPTKITKGTIEITNDVALIKAGDRVGMSEATLLNMLGISPFTYGLGVTKVYDSGSIFDPSIS